MAVANLDLTSGYGLPIALLALSHFSPRLDCFSNLTERLPLIPLAVQMPTS